jgi:predicted Zn-dependent protease
VGASVHEEIVRRFREACPAGLDFASIRVVDERSHRLGLRRGVLDPPRLGLDRGAMITVIPRSGPGKGGLGYAATSDLSASGLRAALDQARAWAERTAARAIFDWSTAAPAPARGAWRSPVARPFDDVPVDEVLGLLQAMSAEIPIDPRVVDWDVSIWSMVTRQVWATSEGGLVEQELHQMAPDLAVEGEHEGRVQRRGAGGRGVARQGGWEALDAVGFRGMARTAAEECVALLEAPECPSGQMSLLLDPGQMMLQIHESIGHPLELDRILGDERNYAGTSFVTLDMFGSYQYGSPLLNVSFAPDVPGQMASYGWDDDGAPASREWIIRDGVLLRPLGGRYSQARAGMPGVAGARATSWNRPPIDRMANLNIEPGPSSFAALVGAVERGVFMASNLSWSIDDSRNKFQFGCEYGRLIEDGELKGVVRNPNYRGVSSTFWRSLVGVGDAGTVQVLGTPFCGKGEPNQIIRVGHASPACLFADVDVFGGA